MTDNAIVETKSIIELRDSRVFYIPAYQRGYRWNDSQVRDLLDDLYDFETKEKEYNEFYCLQPVIVKKLTGDKYKEITQKIEEKITDIENADVYEVIDGQQRLTTIYLLLQFLIQNYSDDEDKADELSHLFNLFFETRQDMFDYLMNIKDKNKYSNIDEKHALETYKTFGKWFEEKATQSLRKGDIARKLAYLLRQDKNTKERCGSVQVIWYEVPENKDVIREFLSTNNGKIKLTEAELIKALFLQKRNYETGSKNLKQIEKSLEWERMENVLHQDDFWYFINNDKSSPSNRIECILKLAINLKKDSQDNALFRAYYELFNKKEGADLEQLISEQWSKIIECFRTIEDWYLDPIKYNYIGYLSQSGVSIFDVYKEYKNLPVDSMQDVFVEEKLKALIKASLAGIEQEKESPYSKYKI